MLDMGAAIVVNNRRSEMEIIKEILLLSQTATRKTQILYQVNLSYKQLQIYLDHLLVNNILQKQEIKNNGSSYSLYQTTQIGNRLLSDINKTLSYFNK